MNLAARNSTCCIAAELPGKDCRYAWHCAALVSCPGGDGSWTAEASAAIAIIDPSVAGGDAVGLSPVFRAFRILLADDVTAPIPDRNCEAVSWANSAGRLSMVRSREAEAIAAGVIQCMMHARWHLQLRAHMTIPCRCLPNGLCTPLIAAICHRQPAPGHMIISDGSMESRS